jgi:hypothetical protein
MAFMIMNLKYSFWTTRERAFVFTRMFHHDLRQQFYAISDLQEYEIAEDIEEDLAAEWNGYELNWEDHRSEMCNDAVTRGPFLEEEGEVENHARDLNIRVCDASGAGK